MGHIGGRELDGALECCSKGEVYVNGRNGLGTDVAVVVRLAASMSLVLADRAGISGLKLGKGWRNSN